MSSEHQLPQSPQQGASPPSDEQDPSFKGGPMVVAIGASAGGVNALQKLFNLLPPDSGLVFIVMLHSAAGPESHLAEVIQKKTSIPVTAVHNAAILEQNNVYCLPSDREIELLDGEVRVTDHVFSENRGAPIDLFFRALAGTYKEKAISVILSGANSDGALGTDRIREQGGVNIVQDPAQAEYPAMPKGAIEQGSVDFILPLNLIPERLLSLRRNAARIRLPLKSPPEASDDQTVNEILGLLRARTRHDFANYKRSTVLRRLERRMQITECEDLAGYLSHMRRHPEEVRGLLGDLLISVTNFFRDPLAFEQLRVEVVPRLFAETKPSDQLRVWVPGCATGEEAYSLAIVLSEFAENLDTPPSLQIFATDIDEEALAFGRNGIYPASIAADVSPHRLRRFFTAEGLFFRVKSELREMVLFAPQNLLRDPPFSKLDLVSCRNLLIYIERQAQERILSTFHFALNSEGYLFLGSSESPEGLSSQFTTVNKKARIFQRDTSEPVAKVFPSAGPAGWAPVSSLLFTPAPQGIRNPVPSYSELHYRMLEGFGPPSVLVDQNYDIVHLSEHAGRYLEMPGGEPSRNLLRVAHPDIRLELRSILIEASQLGAASREIRVVIDGEETAVTISARSLNNTTALAGFYLVTFLDQQSGPLLPKQNQLSRGDANMVLLNVEDQLKQTRDQLRATIEEYETSTEELKASNEELQAMNEELRSASEELETGKEELQSLNEELTTVNSELKEKVDEVSRSNSDLQNFMASTRIATLFIDRGQRIRRYTPSLQEIFNIIPSDLGRPVAHLTHNLTSDDFLADVDQVLNDLQSVEHEVCTKDGHWYILRMLPYRTTEHTITGVVITFTDIHERKTVEEDLRSREERFRLLVESPLDYAIMMTDEGGIFVSWNPAAEKIFGYSASEIIGQHIRTIYTPEDKAAGQDKIEMALAERNGRSLDERWHLRKDGSRLYLSGVMVVVREKSEKRFAKIARDMTEEHQAKEELAKSKQDLEIRVDQRTQELAKANSQLRREVNQHSRSEERRLDLVRRMVGAQEEERRRISRELHDQLGQLLSALRLRLEKLKQQEGESTSVKDVEELVETTKKLEGEVDFLAWELRPSMLDDLGVVATLENYVREWSQHSGIQASFHSKGFGDDRLTWLVETNLYRIAQEALNNVVKHSGAKNVEVLLEPRGNDVVLIVEDDGQGFDPEKAVQPSGRELGLVGIRERAKLMDGTVEIEGAGDKGTTVFVRIPSRFEKDLGMPPR